MERQLHAGHGGKLPAFLLILSADATAAHIPRRAVQRRQRPHRHSTVGIRHRCTPYTSVQRIHRRHFQPQEGAGDMFLLLFYTLLGIYRRGHDADVRNSAYPPRTAIRSRHRGQQHRCHGCTPLGETQRGDRILRTQQQSGHGVCPYCRNLHLLRHRQFRNALLDSLCAGLHWILLRVTHKATLSPCNAQQAEDEP